MNSLGYFLYVLLMVFLKPGLTHKTINCYFGSWANDMVPKYYWFDMDSINPFQCTHISYAFFGINDSYAFDDNETYFGPDNDWLKRLVDLRFTNPSLKIIAVVGGTLVSSARFSEMASNEESRQHFIDTTVEYMDSNNINGLDVYWTYPGSTGNVKDKENFPILLQELSERFQIYGYELGISVIGRLDIARVVYDIPEFKDNVDYINVMAYNYTNGVEMRYHAPLRGDIKHTVESTMNYWIKSGVRREILNLGIAFIARNFNRRGEFTLPYNFVCPLLSDEQQIDSNLGIIQTVIYTTKVFYESSETLQMKLDYVLEQNLGGVMVWTLNNDDYEGKCGGTQYPLLTSISQKIGPTYGLKMQCLIENKTKPIVCFIAYSEDNEYEDEEGEYKVINCYLGSWANDNREKWELFTIDSINPFQCTHISYAFFGISDSYAFDDSKTYFGPQNDWLKRLIELRTANPALKIIAVVGGTLVSSERFSQMASNGESRQIFIDTTVEYLNRNDINGLDLYWTYPGSSGNVNDKDNFSILLQELSERLRIYEIKFGVSVTGRTDHAREWYDIPKLQKYVDFINVMAYNYTNTNEMEYHAPLFGNAKYTVESTISYWIKEGAPREKLNLGIAFIGRAFDKYPGANHELKNISYFEMCEYEQAMQMLFTLYFNYELGESYTIFFDVWIYYESLKSLKMKLNYVIGENLGGVMLWSLENDDYKGKCGRKYPLVKLTNSIINAYNYLGKRYFKLQKVRMLH
ncbi:putative chitinase 10 [Haematobia irritans]|uniref:putative chitinase 10 n=1 Tax=Haematobia irritans TaxID=7368 RepID=UPI003F4FACB6